MEFKDSGTRSQFNDGAVRDAQEGKGRMDLLPVNAMFDLAKTFKNMLGSSDNIYIHLNILVDKGIKQGLKALRGDTNNSALMACYYFLRAVEEQLRLKPGHQPNVPHYMVWNYNYDGFGRFDVMPVSAVFELAKVFEAGAKKYAARNWEKGIPLSRYLDSGLRHGMKVLRGDTDEPHAAMACWNFLCYYETLTRIERGILPKELNDLPWARTKEYFSTTPGHKVFPNGGTVDIF